MQGTTAGILFFLTTDLNFYCLLSVSRGAWRGQIDSKPELGAFGEKPILTENGASAPPCTPWPMTGEPSLVPPHFWRLHCQRQVFTAFTTSIRFRCTTRSATSGRWAHRRGRAPYAAQEQRTAAAALLRACRCTRRPVFVVHGHFARRTLCTPHRATAPLW